MQFPLGAAEKELDRRLRELTQELLHGADRLSNFDVTAPPSQAKVVEEQLLQHLRRFKSILADLVHAANEQERPEEIQTVEQCAAFHQRALESARGTLQQARVRYKLNVERHQEQQRRELIGSVDFSQRQQKFAREQDVLTASEDITATLRRTKQLMDQNLEQTHGNISVLGAGNKRLQSADDELTGHKALYKDAHKQQRTLQKQSWMDRWAMYIGFAFFLLCVGYILVRRTPAFIKQPVYALLHMKQSGEPFTHSDYASVNIPPEMLKPSQQSWGGSDGWLPPEWEAWDSNFEGDSGPEHGTGAFQDAEWLDAEQHEPVGRTGGQVWRRGQQGELLEDMYSGPGTPQREYEAPHQPGYQQHDQGQHTPSGECSAADHAASECSNSPDAHAQHQAHPDSADAFDSWDQWQQQQQPAADAASIGGREPELPPPPAPAPVPLHEEGAPVDVTSHHPPQEQQGSQHGQHQQQEGTWQQQQQQPAGNQGSHADFDQGSKYFDDSQDDGAEDHWGLDDGSLPVPAEPVRSPGDGHQWQPPAPTAAGIVDPDAAAEGAGQHRQSSGQPAGEGPEGFDEDPDELEYWKQQREAEQEAERLHFEQQLAAAAAAEREREQAQAAEQQQQQQQDAAGHQDAAHMQHEHEVPPQQHEAQHDTWSEPVLSEPVHRQLQHDDAQYEAEQQQQQDDAQDEPVQYQQPQPDQAHDEHHHHQQQLGEEDREQVWQEAQQQHQQEQEQQQEQQRQQEPMPREQQQQPPQQDPHHQAWEQTPQLDQHGHTEQQPPPQQQHHDYDEAQWELLKGHDVQMPDDAQIEPISPEHGQQQQQQQQQDPQGASQGQAGEQHQQQQELEQRQAPEHHWEQHQAPEHQWEQQQQQAPEVAAQHGQLQDEAPAPDAMAPQQHEAQWQEAHQQPQVPGEHAMQHEQQVHAPDAPAHPEAHPEAPLHGVDGHHQQQGQEQEHWQQEDQWQHQQEVQQEADRRALEQQQEEWQRLQQEEQQPMEQSEVHPDAAAAPSDVEHAAAEVVHQAAEAAAAASEAAREQAAVLEEAAARLHDAAAAAQEQQQPADMDGFGMPDGPAAPQQPAAGFDHEAMQQEEPRAAVHPTELEQQHSEDAAAAPHQELLQAPEHQHQQPPHMAEQLAALQAQLAAAEQDAAAAEADVLPGLASGHDDMGQQQAQQHHHEGPAAAEEHPSPADPSAAQEQGAAAPLDGFAGEPMERHIAAEQVQQQEPAFHAAPEQHPVEHLEQEHANEIHRRHLADQQQYHGEDLHEQPAVDSWEEPAASLQHPQDEQHVAPAQQPHEEPTVEPPVAVGAEELWEPSAAAAPGEHRPAEAVVQEEAPVGGDDDEEPPAADHAAVEAPAPAAQVPQQQVPQQEVQAADQGYYDLDADGDYAEGVYADGAHVLSDDAQPEVEQPTEVQADMAGSPAAAEPVVPANAAKAPQQQQPQQDLEGEAPAPVAQPGRPVDLDQGPAAASVVGIKQKASSVTARLEEEKAKLADHAAIVPDFEMPDPGADDEEEGEAGQVAAALSGVFNWVKGIIPKAPSPILPVAAAATLNLELRPLEGSEHFFDEPYNDYYFYYDEADGGKGKGKGSQAGATGGKAGVHARPGTKAPTAAQQYQPYDDPEDNTDELDYDAAERFLSGDSSTEADGSQQAPSQGGKESQKRQQQGTTAEL